MLDSDILMKELNDNYHLEERLRACEDNPDLNLVLLHKLRTLDAIFVRHAIVLGNIDLLEHELRKNLVTKILNQHPFQISIQKTTDTSTETELETFVTTSQELTDTSEWIQLCCMVKLFAKQDKFPRELLEATKLESTNKKPTLERFLQVLLLLVENYYQQVNRYIHLPGLPESLKKQALDAQQFVENTSIAAKNILSIWKRGELTLFSYFDFGAFNSAFNKLMVRAEEAIGIYVNDPFSLRLASLMLPFCSMLANAKNALSYPPAKGKFFDLVMGVRAPGRQQLYLNSAFFSVRQVDHYSEVKASTLTENWANISGITDLYLDEMIGHKFALEDQLLAPVTTRKASSQNGKQLQENLVTKTRGTYKNLSDKAYQLFIDFVDNLNKNEVLDANAKKKQLTAQLTKIICLFPLEKLNALSAFFEIKDNAPFLHVQTHPRWDSLRNNKAPNNQSTDINWVTGHYSHIKELIQKHKDFLSPQEKVNSAVLQRLRGRF
jgi:hypothetical protein